MNDLPAPKVLASGKYLRLLAQGHWEFAERVNATGAVVIVALTDEGRLLLVEQYRIPVGCPVIELPAGLVGDVPETESPAPGIRRPTMPRRNWRKPCAANCSKKRATKPPECDCSAAAPFRPASRTK